MRFLFVTMLLFACSEASADLCNWCGCRGGPGYRDGSGHCV